MFKTHVGGYASESDGRKKKRGAEQGLTRICWTREGSTKLISVRNQVSGKEKNRQEELLEEKTKGVETKVTIIKRKQKSRNGASKRRKYAKNQGHHDEHRGCEKKINVFVHEKEEGRKTSDCMWA